ncbi:hypothetical protein K438DRAFT_1960622 [Mycena galopus ATCC 62051]|nr:hypothetical protein K438DRAFT_1960622 [Mycena galopus ATCC 62051]
MVLLPARFARGLTGSERWTRDATLYIHFHCRRPVYVPSFRMVIMRLLALFRPSSSALDRRRLFAKLKILVQTRESQLVFVESESGHHCGVLNELPAGMCHCRRQVMVTGDCRWDVARVRVMRTRLEEEDVDATGTAAGEGRHRPARFALARMLTSATSVCHSTWIRHVALRPRRSRDRDRKLHQRTRVLVANPRVWLVASVLAFCLVPAHAARPWQVYLSSRVYVGRATSTPPSLCTHPFCAMLALFPLLLCATLRLRTIRCNRDSDPNPPSCDLRSVRVQLVNGLLHISVTIIEAEFLDENSAAVLRARWSRTRRLEAGAGGGKNTASRNRSTHRETKTNKKGREEKETTSPVCIHSHDVSLAMTSSTGIRSRCIGSHPGSPSPPLFYFGGRKLLQGVDNLESLSSLRMKRARRLGSRRTLGRLSCCFSTYTRHSRAERLGVIIRLADTEGVAWACGAEGCMCLKRTFTLAVAPKEGNNAHQAPRVRLTARKREFRFPA